MGAACSSVQSSPRLCLIKLTLTDINLIIFKVNVLVAFSILTMLCHYHLSPVPKHSHQPPNALYW